MDNIILEIKIYLEVIILFKNKSENYFIKKENLVK